MTNSGSISPRSISSIISGVAGPYGAWREAFRQSVARLQQASSAAVSTLLKIMVDPNVPASVRVRAADSVLDHSKQAIEIKDVEVRVAALEQAAEQRKT